MSAPSHSSIMSFSSSSKYLFVLSLYSEFQYGSLVKLFLVVQLKLNAFIPKLDTLLAQFNVDIIVSPQSWFGDTKLSLLVYLHGGGCLIKSAYSSIYHAHLNVVVAEAGGVTVSINYRLAPEHHLPIAYEDSQIIVKWAAPHSNGEGPEVWLRDYAGFDRVFFGGDSAGDNLVHNMASRVWRKMLDDFNLDVIFLNCPYFWGKDLISIELTKLRANAYVKGIWYYVNPKSTGVDDPLLNSLMEPNISRLDFVVAKKVGYFHQQEYCVDASLSG
ncbi:probable carboxylesterase 12 [Coffea arabica]|uniref:Probable carboxylesterase 12 n=1 Tax=Coffea arabica TaxID=13443 RepID=A0A6P6VHZ4_COFAR|nr:probable carboxylesterase 12 [Coffea arabica]